MESKRITIMALGGAGCRILGELNAGDFPENFRFLAVDSDIDSLRASGLAESCWLQAGERLRSGRGCGGDVIAGQQALSNERKRLDQLLENTEVMIVIAGLGGGIATGGLPVVLGVAAKKRISTAVLVTLPFSMEGYRRRQLADEKIKNDILPLADAVIALPNDLLFSTLEAETAFSDALRVSDRELSRTLLALAAIMGGANLFNADFASFTGVMKRRHALCALGTATVDASPDAAEKLMEIMLSSPLLGGPDTLDNADAVAFSLLGGPELSLGSARAVLDLCSRQINPDMEKTVLMGAATAEQFAGKLQLTSLSVRYLDRPVPAADASRKTVFNREKRHIGNSDPGMQMDLPNLIVEEKGIMENTAPVMFDGEDLDVPTFRRRGLVIDV